MKTIEVIYIGGGSIIFTHPEGEVYEACLAELRAHPVWSGVRKDEDSPSDITEVSYVDRGPMKGRRKAGIFFVDTAARSEFLDYLREREDVNIHGSLFTA